MEKEGAGLELKNLGQEAIALKGQLDDAAAKLLKLASSSQPEGEGTRNEDIAAATAAKKAAEPLERFLSRAFARRLIDLQLG